MTLYNIVLFLHVTGALMLSAAIALEWLCIIYIRNANTTERIGESLLYYSKLGRLGDMAAFLLLFPGIYMMVAVWGDAPWGIVGFLGLMAIGMIGGIVTGRKMKTIGKMIKAGNNSLSQLETIVGDNSLRFSIKMRTAIFLGVIFLMTVKPKWAGSIIVMIVSVILGALSFRMKWNSQVAEATKTAKESDR